MSDLNSVIMGEGDEARRINEKKANSVKVRFLKKGQTVKGRIITSRFVTYAQHGSFESKVQSHACIDPKGKTNCPSCKAGVPRSTRTLVFFWDSEASEIVVKDAAKATMTTVYDFVDTYGDKDDPLAIRATAIKATMGEKGAISLLPLPPKEAEKIAPIPDTVVIDEDVLKYVMNVKTADEMPALFAGKFPQTGEANAQAKIERDGDGQAPSEHF